MCSIKTYIFEELQKCFHKNLYILSNFKVQVCDEKNSNIYYVDCTFQIETVEVVKLSKSSKKRRQLINPGSFYKIVTALIISGLKNYGLEGNVSL